MQYEQATFRILIDGLVQVEVSISGNKSSQHSATPEQLSDAATTMRRIGRAIQKIQRVNDRERGRRASQAAA